MPEYQKLEVGWQTFWRLFVFGVILLTLYFAREAVGVLLLAIVISLGLDPVVSFLEERKINRLLGTLAVFLGGLIAVGVILYFIFPTILVEATGFLSKINQVVSLLFKIGLPASFIKNVSISIASALGFISNGGLSITGAISSVFTKIVLALSTVLISFYLSIERDGTDRFLRVLLPSSYERSVLAVFTSFKIKIRRWFAAQLALSLIMGILVFFGMWILGVKYALVLGIIAALFEVVPVIGPVLTGAVIFSVAVTDSVSLGFYALLFSFIVQQLENHVLIPLIVGRTMKIHPVIVIISLLAGGQVAGLLGIILSVPIAIIAQETFNYLVERKSRKNPLGI